MKEVTGRIVSWDEASSQGMIEGDDGSRYPFGLKEWADKESPEVDGGVLVICQNGRDASQVEYLGIEHMPFLKITAVSEQGEVRTFTHSRFIGGAWRMRSDAIVWMAVAKGLHKQNAHRAIGDISDLLKGEHPMISLRGSVVKYSYGIAIELYVKWILAEAKIKYKKDHRLPQLVRKLPPPVLYALRSVYLRHLNQGTPRFRMMEANVCGVKELDLDWTSFDKFIKNLEDQKFVVGRYANPDEYSIFPSLSSQMSSEMNSYMDSDDFFVLGDKLLAYMPNPGDYPERD